MGWIIKVDFTETELNIPAQWIRGIVHDSIYFMEDERLAFEFNTTIEIGYAIHNLKMFNPKMKVITKPVLRVV